MYLAYLSRVKDHIPEYFFRILMHADLRNLKVDFKFAQFSYNLNYGEKLHRKVVDAKVQVQKLHLYKYIVVLSKMETPTSVSE